MGLEYEERNHLDAKKQSLSLSLRPSFQFCGESVTPPRLCSSDHTLENSVSNVDGRYTTNEKSEGKEPGGDRKNKKEEEKKKERKKERKKDVRKKIKPHMHRAQSVE
jgi:hypothetical protein